MPESLCSFDAMKKWIRLLKQKEKGTMRILIFGAGVIGSLYGALLAEAGYDVSVMRGDVGWKA